MIISFIFQDKFRLELYKVELNKINEFPLDQLIQLNGLIHHIITIKLFSKYNFSNLTKGFNLSSFLISL